MDGTRFDRVSRMLAGGATRRRLLAGIGVVATGGALGLGRTVAAAPSSKAACQKACNAAAKESRRDSCAGLKSKEKNVCLKGVKAERATCRQACHQPEAEAA